ncbi:hypothetical protein PG996_012955 [Apiospora saccharicola]|uniref:Uncharacterized protein n=1 Tax=Apiospora saccharicola TaxID=335842 RepID=A0ABR1U431_9PEZI
MTAIYEEKLQKVAQAVVDGATQFAAARAFRPLDIGPFSVLNRRFRRELDKACAVSNDSHVRKGDFLRAWALTCGQALPEKAINGGYSATGMSPPPSPGIPSR